MYFLGQLQTHTNFDAENAVSKLSFQDRRWLFDSSVFSFILFEHTCICTSEIHTDGHLQGLLNMRSVRLSVSRQGIGTSCASTLCKSLWTWQTTSLSFVQQYGCEPRTVTLHCLFFCFLIPLLSWWDWDVSCSSSIFDHRVCLKLI